MRMFNLGDEGISKTYWKLFIFSRTLVMFCSIIFFFISILVNHIYLEAVNKNQAVQFALPGSPLLGQGENDVKPDSCQITIRNWEKFNPKINQHQQSHSWLRLSNNIPFSSDLEELTHEHKWIFVTLLCEASKRMKQSFEIRLSYLARAADSTREKVLETLEILSERNICHYKPVVRGGLPGEQKSPPQVVVEPSVEVQGALIEPEKSPPAETKEGTPATYVRNDTNVTNAPNERKKPIRTVAAPKLPPTPSPTQRVIARYCDLWKDRWKATAPIGGMAAGQFKTLVKDHGEEKAMRYVEAYLKMNLSWFVTKRHDIGVLLSNLNAVAHFMETGQQISATEIKQLDSRSHTHSMLERVDSGEI